MIIHLYLPISYRISNSYCYLYLDGIKTKSTSLPVQQFALLQEIQHHKAVHIENLQINYNLTSESAQQKPEQFSLDAASKLFKISNHHLSHVIYTFRYFTSTCN